jgi:hypothetical protein
MTAAFAGSDVQVISSPIVMGSGLFHLAVVSAALGCHLLTDASAARRATTGGAEIINRLRSAARDAGWDRVHAWAVGEERDLAALPAPFTPFPASALAFPDAARQLLAGDPGMRRPPLSARRRAMDLVARAFRDPLGAFDVDAARKRPRGTGAGGLRSQLDGLDAWLAAQELARGQSDVVAAELGQTLLELRGPAGSGKTTVLARHAARAIAQLGVDARRGDAPRILVTAGSASAAAQLRARVLAAHRRWSLAARLPAWVDGMELPRAVERIRALRKAGGFGGYLRVMVDEAQELDERWLRWLVGTALHPDDPRRGVMLCVDPSQRLVPAWPRLTPIAEERGLEHRAVLFDTAYRTPRQVLEFAFNVLHGAFAVGADRGSPRGDELIAMRRSAHVGCARDGWLKVRFAMRGTGIEGAPEGATPRAMRAPSTRHAALAAVRDAIALVDVHGAMPRDVVVVAMDPKSALAVARAAVAARVSGRFTRRAKDPSCPPADQIRILQVSECRGHDFPVVLLVGIERLADGAAERTLFYRAATRAQHLLMAFGVAGQGLSDEVAECALRCSDRG